MTTATQPHQPFEATVAAHANKALEQYIVRGLAVAIVRNGAIVYERGFGVADPAGNAVSSTTPFAIGSLTKQFTAVSVLISAERKRLALADSLSAYLPMLPNAGLITIHQLLNQTSGLHNYPNTREHDWPLTGTIEPAALFALLAQDPSDFKPGTRFEYSNTNYAALAAIVAKANGIAYGPVLTSNIFTPLGMTHSGYGYAAQAGAATATGADGFTWIEKNDRLSLDLYYGAGGIVSSVHDMSLWNRALLSSALVSSKSRALLWAPGKLNDGSEIPYAMGFVPTAMNGRQEVWHNGYAPTAGGYCYNALFPNDGLAVVVLTNSGNLQIEDVSRAMVRSVFESYFSDKAVGEDPAVTARVRNFLAQARLGKIERDGLTPEFSSFLNFGLVFASRFYFNKIGEPTSLVLQNKTRDAPRQSYRYRGVFADGSVHDVFISLDGDKISGFQVPP